MAQFRTLRPLDRGRRLLGARTIGVVVLLLVTLAWKRSAALARSHSTHVPALAELNGREGRQPEPIGLAGIELEGEDQWQPGEQGGTDDTQPAEQGGTGSSQGAEAEPAAARGAGLKIGTYIDTLADGSEATRDLLDEPLPADCYAEAHADYDGPSVTWGLTYKLPSAARCCEACKDLRPGEGGKFCNVWVFCPDPSGQCWSPDIWNHTSGECWLKFQEDWDNNVDLSVTNLAVNSRGDYPPGYRQEHKTAPASVAWMAGVIPRQDKAR